MSDPKTPVDELEQPLDETLDDKDVDASENVSVESIERDTDVQSDTVVDEEETTPDTESEDGSDSEMSAESADDSLSSESDANETPDVDANLEADPAAHDDVVLGDADDEEVEDVEKGDPYGGHQHEHLKRILEGALFASGATLSVSHLRDMFEAHERPHGKIVRQIMSELIALYEDRGMQLVEVASGYRFQTESSIAQWISRLWEEKPQRYSRALMETIALVAYRQPITRGEIEDVRGVAVSSNIIRTLLEREWVRVVGHRDVPGRPAMYATTRQFLDYFGLKSLDQLPSLSEIRDMDELNPQMDLDDGTAETTDDETQNEITFSGMIDKIRETQQSGKTGSEFIDEKLDDELAAMDEVNRNFEKSLEQQRAEHEHPDLDLDDDDDDVTSESNQHESAATIDSVDAIADAFEADVAMSDSETDNVEHEELNETTETDEPPLSEEEQWKIIQEKLAQQQALLDARESDPQGEDENNE